VSLLYGCANRPQNLLDAVGFRRPESVLVLVYTAACEVLLLKRTRPKAFWQSVTGSLEDWETPADAACRELTEETGIRDATLIDCAHSNFFVISEPWRDRYAPGVTHNQEHVFCCRLNEKPSVVKLAPDEHSEYMWVPVQNAMGIVSSWTNRQALEQFVAIPASASKI